MNSRRDCLASVGSCAVFVVLVLVATKPGLFI